MSTTNPINRTTEWDDLQIKYGNYAPLAPETKEEECSLRAQEALVNAIDPYAKLSLHELDEELDAGDGSDEKIIEAYRQKRLEELKLKKSRARFRGVYLVSMDNYVEQVTLASADDTVVVLHLFDDAVPACEFLNRAFEQLAQTHQDVKFCKGKAANVLQKFNPKNLPTIVIYKNKNCVHQIMGISVFGSQPTDLKPEVVEFVLAKQYKLFELDGKTADPRAPASRLRKYLKGHVSDDSSSDGESEIREEALHTVAGDKGYADVDLDRLLQVVRK